MFLLIDNRGDNMFDHENKLAFQFGLETNHKEIAKQQLLEAEEMADTFNKVYMPKIEKIAEWHQSSDDSTLIPDVLREILLGWFMSNQGLAGNWIKKEFNTIKANT
jgi:DNA-directed RNA polymerase specialized sigma subunit